MARVKKRGTWAGAGHYSVYPDFAVYWPPDLYRSLPKRFQCAFWFDTWRELRRALQQKREAAGD